MPTQRPPDVPPLTGMSPAAAQALSDYLRRLAMWAYQEIDAKVPKAEAVPQLLLSPITEKPPVHIFGVVVNSSGVLATQAVPLGSGKP